ncbi:pentatricopeptide repeat-containing protein At2g21090 [Mercurialis annua]|uniref:pentatricopeptide repeat-containing protein At2g21090 n=1 Tax=Mercurialis annua TaxID=3986 RepID=UPI00215F1CEA|nr:pentatricopeptide repeat-containing protein At2g21090 [Mercurialis annua]XP_055962034.1 pentatricopeptide repeat-containing protein At2g21090 [Mercurialis annua]XP_055962035.1 pentatricopeptide repeat-containing protein At2g21090 [Mercurialis annua]XP_055962036.1 pentatricopeptide repeat-containing protein At2g21090 [Mercurialis annua]XP_055962037.1 pentatricopeptide repeat-containing protein At2g21090 [Mercurialis annua]XP_055962038.1 pentatricopeptide repeat-containing protein At2g21090 [
MPSFSKSQSIRTKQTPCVVKSLLNLVSSGQLYQAISSLHLLSRRGIRLPAQTLAYLLQQCANSKSLKLGKWVHLYLKLTGMKRPNTLLANNLINMYSNCGDFDSACKVFDKMSVRNLYSWNNMLSGYAKLGKIKPARKLFDQMTERDVVSWNTMVIAYAQSGFCEEALRFYRDFRELGIGYNAYSFAGLLKVCVKIKELELSRQAHGQVLVAGFLSNLVISSSILDAYAKCSEMGGARRLFYEMIVRDVLAWTTMVSGYAQLGDMEAAKELFDLMPNKNPVSWTSLIAGYARHGLGHEALELFTMMMELHYRPDQFTFSSCICACASIASLNHGKQIHGYLIRTNFRPNTIVVSSLIDMYSKCGWLNIGRLVFDLMGDKRDVVLWNTMISALAQHGRGEEAIQMFNDMIGLSMKPDGITMVVILNACSHSGLVHEGLRIFDSMTSCHGIVPSQEHYACLIDLLGRSGHFDKLINQLEKMPCKPNDQIWNALVGVCRIHGNIELGSKVAEKLIELKPQSSAAYVLLSSIYGALGRWELVEKVRHLMNERQIRKERALSWIEIENKVHSFTVTDRLHPLKEVIYLVLEQLAGHMEEEVSSPNCER